jgi:hypothetical protein
MSQQPVPAGAGKPAFDWRLLLSSLSSAYPVYAQSRAADRQQEELARGQLEAAQKQRAADTAIGDEITKLRGSEPYDIENRSLRDYSAALSRARAAPGASTVPNLGGERYQADKGAANRKTVQYGTDTAKQLARIDAPTYQRQQEAQGFARAGSEVQQLGREAQTAQFLAQLAAQRRGRVNPWIGILSNMGQTIARNWEKPEPADPLPPIEVSDYGTRLPYPRVIPPMKPMPIYSDLPMPAGAGVRLRG